MSSETLIQCPEEEQYLTCAKDLKNKRLSFWGHDYKWTKLGKPQGQKVGFGQLRCNAISRLKFQTLASNHSMPWSERSQYAYIFQGLINNESLFFTNQGNHHGGEHGKCELLHCDLCAPWSIPSHPMHPLPHRNPDVQHPLPDDHQYKS